VSGFLAHLFLSEGVARSDEEGGREGRIEGRREGWRCKEPRQYPSKALDRCCYDCVQTLRIHAEGESSLLSNQSWMCD